MAKHDKPEAVNHPKHYGGKDAEFEPLKIIFAMGWGPEFCKGNALKYVLRAGKKPLTSEREDIEKAAFYLNYLAEQMRGETQD